MLEPVKNALEALPAMEVVHVVYGYEDDMMLIHMCRYGHRAQMNHYLHSVYHHNLTLRISERDC